MMRFFFCFLVSIAAWPTSGVAQEASQTKEREPVALDKEDVLDVLCEISGKGQFRIRIVPEWAPLGAKRFIDLVNDNFFDGIALFRAVDNFLVQFGIAKDPTMNEKWANQALQDDPKLGIRIRRGTMAFAGSGPNSRSTQLFVTLGNDLWPHLGKEPWETPFGYVEEEDMQAVWSHVNTKYGDIKPWGRQGVDVGKIWSEGYGYLSEGFPDMDYISYCKIVDTLPKNKEPIGELSPAVGEDTNPADTKEQLSPAGIAGVFVLLFLLTSVAKSLIRRRSQKEA